MGISILFYRQSCEFLLHVERDKIYPCQDQKIHDQISAIQQIQQMDNI